MSTPLINVTLGGKEEINDIVESIRDKVAISAAKSTFEGSVGHIEQAKTNVHEAYTTAKYPKISLGYAEWLVKLHSSALGETLSEKEIKDRAVELVNSKQSMILTGSLVNGIGMKAPSIEGNRIIGEISSSSEYSDDLEKGYLFGELRPNKKRPFFTGHELETDQKMRKFLLDHLEGEEF